MGSSVVLGLFDLDDLGVTWMEERQNLLVRLG
jgi:hypothetical protein